MESAPLACLRHSLITHVSSSIVLRILLVLPLLQTLHHIDSILINSVALKAIRTLVLAEHSLAL